jgi:hypothetical protein
VQAGGRSFDLVERLLDVEVGDLGELLSFSLGPPALAEMLGVSASASHLFGTIVVGADFGEDDGGPACR